MAITLQDIYALGTVLALVLTVSLPKRIMYAVHGVILLVFGVTPFLFYINVTKFDLYSNPLIRYIILFVVIVAGKEMFKEGLRHKKGLLNILSIILGVLIIFITAIPTLSRLNAVSFSLPEYSPFIDFIVYFLSGLMLLLMALRPSSSR